MPYSIVSEGALHTEYTNVLMIILRWRKVYIHCFQSAICKERQKRYVSFKVFVRPSVVSPVMNTQESETSRHTPTPGQEWLKETKTLPSAQYPNH